MPDYKENETANILKEFNLHANNLCYEITEYQNINDTELIKKAISRYKRNEYNIAIDDFGTGVSGLHLLYISDTNFIKIDRFFIQDINNDSKKRLFCASIVEMAHILGIKVIAEGVETIEEYYICKEIKVDYIQGFLVAKPSLDIKDIKKSYSDEKYIFKNDRRVSNNNFIDKSYIQKIDPLNVKIDLHELFIYFKEHTRNTFVPIIDDDEKIVGAIYEVDIKEISYSQYGLSLAKNSSYKDRLKAFIRPVVEIDLTWGIDKALEIFNMNNNAKGIFVSKDSKYYGFISLSNLLSLSYKRNIEIAQNQNPLTKLPGNDQIDEFITSVFKKDKNAHIVYFDFNDFKPFNDHYGFRQGDRAILMFSEILRKHLSVGSFIAHIGGDDFFVGFIDEKYDHVYKLISKVQEEFKISVSSLYSKEDLNNNYITTKDRFGVTREFNLLSVCAAIIETNKNSTFKQFNEHLGEIKKSSKKNAYPMGVCTIL